MAEKKKPHRSEGTGIQPDSTLSNILERTQNVTEESVTRIVAAGQC